MTNEFLSNTDSLIIENKVDETILYSDGEMSDRRQGVLLFNGLECLKDFFAALYNFKWLYLFLYDNESPFFFLPLKTPI